MFSPSFLFLPCLSLVWLIIAINQKTTLITVHIKNKLWACTVYFSPLWITHNMFVANAYNNRRHSHDLHVFKVPVLHKLYLTAFLTTLCHPTQKKLLHPYLHIQYLIWGCLLDSVAGCSNSAKQHYSKQLPSKLQMIFGGMILKRLFNCFEV